MVFMGSPNLQGQAYHQQTVGGKGHRAQLRLESLMEKTGMTSNFRGKSYEFKGKPTYCYVRDGPDFFRKCF